MSSSPKKGVSPPRALIDSKSLNIVESRIFRCGVDDFNSLLKNEKEYRFEYDCGGESGEKVKLWFIIQAPARSPKSCTKRAEYLDIRGGVFRNTKLSYRLSVTPKVLNHDETIFLTCDERSIDLKRQSSLQWSNVLDTNVLRNTKSVTEFNECLFNFDVVLLLDSRSSSSSTSSSSSSSRSESHKSSSNVAQQKVSSSERTGLKRASESSTRTSDSVKKVKLDSMQAKLTTDLKNILESQDMADVTFTIKEVTVKAHRLILSGRSKALAAMLNEENKVDGSWNVELEDVDLPVMKAILEYIYTGKVDESWKKCPDKFLTAASRFELTELVDYLDYKIPDLFTVENSCTYLQLSQRLGLKTMEKEMMKFFLKNRDAIVKTQGFEDLRQTNPAVLVDWLLAK